MPEIRILPDHVANQIAAGEVVERPMSVVKELLENAVDAGATRIAIEFRNGGKSFISIEDNGCGMSRDQALLALERHATSKLRQASDLDRIHSFGFRGEALPSIASVSRFLLRTRESDSELGTEILVEGGKYRHCREAGMPAGTRIEVSRLFFNVPARLKFLKSENTEAAHITRCVRLYAVSHPEIAFSLRENGREIFRSPAGTDLLRRVEAIWGRQLAEDLMPLREHATDEMKVSGLVGKPGASRAARTEMTLFVNGRPADNRTMAYSLVESYHTLIPRGRYPLAFLFLDVDPRAVDVNVHPAKREVRFRNESAVRNLIISAVLQTLGETAHDGVPARGGERQPAPAEAPFPRAETAFPAFPRKNAETVPGVPVPAEAENAEAETAVRRAGAVPAEAAFPREPRRAFPPETNSPTPNPPNFPPPPSPAPRQRISRSTWRHIGKLGFDGLHLFQVEDALLVFNARLALQRIWYERALERFEKSERRSQALLIPEPVEFEPVLADALRRNTATLEQAGFAVEEFGRNFFRVTEVPDWLPPSADVKMFVRDLVDRLARLPADFSRGNVAHEAIARIAATQAQQGKSAGDDGDCRELLSELFATSQPNVGPNGQKIFFEISRAEIARRFQ